MYYVYILKSLTDKKFYTGMTIDLEKRLKEHNMGKSSTPSTLTRGPFQLIHVETLETRVEARALEKYFKSGTGREIRDQIVKEWCL